MNHESIEQLSTHYLQRLSVDIQDRSVGSAGNQAANQFIANELDNLGWRVIQDKFDALDWEDHGAMLSAMGQSFEVFVSPYSLACQCEGELLPIENMSSLRDSDLAGKIVFLYGDIAKEQLMPKKFVFYNPEEHRQIIQMLEEGNPRAVLAATGRNPELAGGIYPFPLIEDGDFLVPAAYMTEEEGQRLLATMPESVKLVINSQRLPSTAMNVTAFNLDDNHSRVVVSAHMDAKKGSPGALDNASGVVVILLLAHLLKNKPTKWPVELAFFNGEDYYCAPGQMQYLQNLGNDLSDIYLNINIDGAGYHTGPGMFSCFDLPNSLLVEIAELLQRFPDLEEGAPWYQGDHSIFLQQGRPAIAITSQWFLENINTQDITHTSRDVIGNIDPNKLVTIALALSEFLQQK